MQALVSGIKALEENATKHDQEKVRLELLPQEALEEVAKVLTHGAEKYGEHNWRKGMHWTRFVGAALRHLYAWQSGMEDRDPESGLSHLAHAACCILFLLVYEKLGLGEDDRWRK
jgi:hypothetical protein